MELQSGVRKLEWKGESRKFRLLCVCGDGEEVVLLYPCVYTRGAETDKSMLFALLCFCVRIILSFVWSVEKTSVLEHSPECHIFTFGVL